MAKKFCKIIENNKGEQLLLRLQPSEGKDRELADLVFTLKFGEDGIVSLTLGGLEWEDAEDGLEKFTEEQGRDMLANPAAFIKGMYNG